MSESKKPVSRRPAKDRSKAKSQTVREVVVEQPPINASVKEEKPQPPTKIPPISVSAKPNPLDKVAMKEDEPPVVVPKKRVRKPAVKKEVSKIPTSEQYASSTPNYYGSEETDIISRAGDMMFPFADLAFVLVSLNKYSLRMFGKGTENLDTSKMVYLARRITRLKCMKERNFDLVSIKDFKDRVTSLKQYLSEEALVGFLRAEIDNIITNFDPMNTGNDKILILINAAEQIHFILNPDVKLK